MPRRGLRTWSAGAGEMHLPPVEPLAWTGSPDAFHAVRVAEAEIAVADAGVDRAQAAWKPDWGLSVTWQQRDSGGRDVRFPGDDWVSAAVTFSVPLWGNRSQAPALRAARAQRGKRRKPPNGRRERRRRAVLGPRCDTPRGGNCNGRAEREDLGCP